MRKRLTYPEKLLLSKRGYISKFPKNKRAVIIISGGLDSTVTAARLIEDFDFELFPLHIHRGQTNWIAEDKSVDFFTKIFQKRYGQEKFHSPSKISVNIPPKEFKQDLLSYTKIKGYPMRDPIMQLLGVEYAVATSQKFHKSVKTVYCSIVPGDYFPHCTLEGLRANTLNTCINMDDWDWQITSPNLDPYLTELLFGKTEEIKWALSHHIPIELTVSCNYATEKTNFLACGKCKSCIRRYSSFKKTGFKDPTKYFHKIKRN